MPASFNRIAPIYDQLSFLVFRNRLIEAKKAFVSFIPRNSRVLLMGGGTGNILNFILSSDSSVIIDFVDPSSKMISIARKNLHTDFQPQVNFICGDETSIPAGIAYDVSSSFFVMDCFIQENALAFAKAITASLKQNGIWLFADFFDSGNVTHRFIVKSMYQFFRIVAGIESSKLPEYEKVFQQSGFNAVNEKEFMNGLVKSIVLKRS
jgi:tRNA (cmo5U34)-methyltransferase